MLINPLKPAGPKNRQLWERADQLVKTEVPNFSTACYQAYDELWHPACSTSHGGAAGTPGGKAPLISVPRRVIDFAPGPVEASPPTPSLNSLADVLAANELNYDALAACVFSNAALAYDAAKVKANPDLLQAFEGGATFAFGYSSAGHTFLAFRGSRIPFEKGIPWSERMEILWGDWVCTDFNFIPWYWPLRHLGFARAWSRIRKQVVTWLSSVPEDSRHLVLTGHSLGGALALVAAFDLAQDFRIRAVITFGAPRVGFFLFRHRYHTRLSKTETLHSLTRRYTHRTDLVSRMPPPLLYCHVGDEYVVEDWGEIEKGRPLDRISRFEEWLGSWKVRIMLWQEKFLPEKDRTLVLRSPQGSDSGPPPGDVKVPYEQSREKRQESAWGTFGSRSPSVMGLLAQAPVLVMWLVGVGICLGFALGVLRDLFVAHPSGKYREAFKRAYPNLSNEIISKP